MFNLSEIKKMRHFLFGPAYSKLEKFKNVGFTL